MSVRDHPTWGCFETTDFSDHTKTLGPRESKNQERDAWLLFSYAFMSTHWAIRRVKMGIFDITKSSGPTITNGIRRMSPKKPNLPTGKVKLCLAYLHV